MGLYAQALSVYRMGELAQARALMDQAVELDPTPEIWFDWARLACQMGDFEAVVKGAERPEETPEVLYMLGLAQRSCGREEPAVAAFLRALSMAPGPDLALELRGCCAESLTRLGRWQEAREEALAGLPATRGLLAQIEVRLGRAEEALELLRGCARLTVEQEYLLKVLEGEPPTVEVAAVEVLHSQREWRDLTRLEVQPWLALEPGAPKPPMERLLTELRELHLRQFPGTELEFKPIRKWTGEGFHQLRDLLDVGQATAVPEYSLVVFSGTETAPYSAGVGVDRVALVNYASGDPFLTTLAAHEFYHAMLDLAHSDGVEDRGDPESLMGVLGRRCPPRWAYLNPEQRRQCRCSREVQELASIGEYEQALELDPDYLALYPPAVARSLEPEPLFLEWLRHDGGLPARVAWGSYLLCYGRPREAEAAWQELPNHPSSLLYQAFACLDNGFHRRALRYFKLAEELGGPSLFVDAGRGWAHHRLNQVPSARRHYRRALRRLPDWTLVRARLELLEERPVTAEPDRPELAWLVARGRPPREALEILGAWPEDPACLFASALILVGLGELHPAAGAFLKTEELNRHSGLGRLSRAWVEHLEGNSRKARAAARPWLREFSSSAPELPPSKPPTAELRSEKAASSPD